MRKKVIYDHLALGDILLTLRCCAFCNLLSLQHTLRFSTDLAPATQYSWDCTVFSSFASPETWHYGFLWSSHKCELGPEMPTRDVSTAHICPVLELGVVCEQVWSMTAVLQELHMTEQSYERIMNCLHANGEILTVLLTGILKATWLVCAKLSVTITGGDNGLGCASQNGKTE